MSWIGPSQAIETKVSALETESSLPLLWALHVDPEGGGRPSSVHIVWSVVYTGAQPLEVGWALESAADNPPDEVTGEVQFDIYSPAEQGTSTVYSYGQTIRAHFRGVSEGGVRYGVPDHPQFLGVEPGGWARWVQRVPFSIEDA